jgi:hypothetical protein
METYSIPSNSAFSSHLWPQYLDGAHPRRSQYALRSEARTADRSMRYLSVCSGIEAVSVAWGPLGWQPAMFAEIDPFCCWLLAAALALSRIAAHPHAKPT